MLCQTNSFCKIFGTSFLQKFIILNKFLCALFDKKILPVIIITVYWYTFEYIILFCFEIPSHSFRIQYNRRLMLSHAQYALISRNKQTKKKEEIVFDLFGARSLGKKDAKKLRDRVLKVEMEKKNDMINKKKVGKEFEILRKKTLVHKIIPYSKACSSKKEEKLHYMHIYVYIGVSDHPRELHFFMLCLYRNFELFCIRIYKWIFFPFFWTRPDTTMIKLAIPLYCVLEDDFY